MRRLALPLSIVLASVLPLVMGWLAAGWLVNRLEAVALKGWVVGLLTADILTLLLIAGGAIYRDKLWHGLMHPIAFISSVVLVILALLSLPSLWQQLRLLAEGETAVGTVEALTTGLDYDSETNITNTRYYLTYHFTTDSGESYRNRIQVTQAVYQTISEGSDIRIVYLSDRLDYSLPEMGIEPDRRARRIFTFLLAIYGVLGETAVATHLGKKYGHHFD
jgi:hypothetical protein